MENNMKASGNFELILSRSDDGIFITIYKKFGEKLMVIDYSIVNNASFVILKNSLIKIEEIEAGQLLYSGEKNMQELTSSLVDFGFKVGINNAAPKVKTPQEKIASLEVKLSQAAEDEDFVLAASYRDQIKELKKML
jgi:hypothetical protein